jgi:protein AFG1
VATASIDNGVFEDDEPAALCRHADKSLVNRDDIGPIQEYDRRVLEGRLKNDEHQRGELPTRLLSPRRNY